MHPKLKSFATFMKEFQSFNPLFKLHFIFSSATLLNSILFSSSLSTCGLNFNFMKNTDILKHNFPLLELQFYWSVLISCHQSQRKEIALTQPLLSYLMISFHVSLLSSILHSTNIHEHLLGVRTCWRETGYISWQNKYPCPYILAYLLVYAP